MIKKTVLIAEGDLEFSDLLQCFLKDRGFRVESASDGLECLAKLRKSLPAVLVLDAELLWGGGDGVLSWLHEEQAVPAVSVILTATAGASFRIIDDIDPLVIKFLAKPFRLMTLLRYVCNAMGDQQNQRFAESRPWAAGLETPIG